MQDSELDALLDEYGDFDTLIQALIEKAEASETAEEKSHCWELVAEARAEYMEDLPGAIEALEHADEALPENAALLERLASLYEKACETEALATLLVELSGLAATPEDGVEHLLRAAAIYRDDLQMGEAARLVLQKALDEAPLDTAIWSKVEELWSADEAWEELATLFSEHASRVAELEGEEATLPLLTTVARAWRSAGNLTLAEAFMSRAILLAPRDGDLLKEQLALLQASGEHDEVQELYQKLVDAESDAATRAGHRLELARLQLGKEGAGLTQARTTLERALDDAPEQPEARKLLVEVLERLGDSEALVTWIRRWVPQAEGADKRALLVQLAGIQENWLERPAAAAETLEEALEGQGEDLQLLRELLRLYERLERPNDRFRVAQVLSEQLLEAGALEVGEWRDLALFRIGHLRSQGETQAALGVAQELWQRVPGDSATLPILEELRAELGDTAGALEALRGRIDRERDPATLESLRLRLAQGEAAADPEQAAMTYREILEASPKHQSALAGLSDCLERLEDWDALAVVLGDRAALTREFVPHAALLARLGEISQAHLAQEDEAVAAWEEALSLDPGCFAAIRPLSEIRVAREEWVRARPLLESLLEKSEEGPQAFSPELDRRRLHRDLARARQALGEDDAALQAWYLAEGLEPLSVDENRELAALLERSGKLAEASQRYLQLEASLDAEERAGELELLRAAARTSAAAGESDQAKRLYREILDHAADDADALKGLASLETGAAPLERAQLARSLYEASELAAEKFRYAIEAGDAFAEADEPEEALASYGAALEIEPGSRAALHKLLATHTATENWADAADILKRLTEIEESLARRTVYRMTAGALYRDQLNDVERAFRMFNALLDEDPTHAEAMEAIAGVLGGVSAWSRLASAYVRHLERLVSVSDVDDTRYAILNALGALYRDKLSQPEQAQEAYRAAADLRPDELKPLLAIAEIYPPRGKTDADVIQERRAIVLLDPTHADSLHVLLGALKRQRRFDEAWNVAAALTVLGERDASTTEFYRENASAPFRSVRRGLGREDWARVQVGALSEPTARLLSVIGASLRHLFSTDPREQGINRRRDTLSAADAQGLFASLQYTCQVLGVPQPEVVRSSAPGLANANFDPRALLAGPDLLTAPPDRTLMFRTARIVASLRNEFYLASALSPQTLVTLVRATIAVFSGGIPPAWDSPTLRSWVDAISREPRDRLGVLRDAVADFAASGEVLDLKSFPASVEKTSARMALLLSGDLQRAAQGLAANDGGETVCDVHELVLDLLRFALSEDYAALRGELGLGLGQG